MHSLRCAHCAIMSCNYVMQLGSCENVNIYMVHVKNLLPIFVPIFVPRERRLPFNPTGDHLTYTSLLYAYNLRELM